MKTWKQLNVMVVLAVLLMMAVPSVTNAGVIEGSSRTSAPEIEITGALEEMGNGYVVVDGQTVEIGSGAEIKGLLAVGDVVKVHARVDGQGNWVAREIEPADDYTFDDNSNATDRLDNNSNGDDMSNANDDDVIDNGNSNDDDMSNSNDHGMSNANDDDMSNANDDDDNGNSNDDDHSNANDDDNDDHDNSSDDDHSNSDDDHGNSSDDDHDDDRGNDNDDDD